MQVATIIINNCSTQTT